MSPAVEAEIRRISSAEDPGWEYLVFAARLDAGATAVAHGGGAVDVERRFQPIMGRAKTLQSMSDDRRAAVDLLDGFDDILSTQRVEAAFGAPGEPGDPAKIVDIAETLLARYDAMLQWRERARSGRTEDLNELLAIHAKFFDQPIQQVEDYIDRWVDFASRLPDLLRAAESSTEPIQIDMSLVLTADDSLIQRFKALSASLDQAA
jgi:hypothetical protein